MSIEQITVLDKIKAQPHNSTREQEEFIDASKKK